jgi:hypothetical protein
MTFKSKLYSALAGVMLSAAGAGTGQAQSAIVTFSVDMATNIAAGTFTPGSSTLTVNGTYNGWGTGTPLVQEGSSTIFTNTVADSGDAVGGVLGYKFVANGTYESLPTGQNRPARMPSIAGASLVLPTPFFNDAGAPVTNDVTFQVDMSQQINIGAFTNGEGIVEVRGLFNGWTGGANVLALDPLILVTNKYGLVTSDVYTGTVAVVASPNAAMAFKFVFDPPTNDYEGVTSINADGGGNRFFDNYTQVLPLVYFSDQPFAPTAQVTFNVDMTVVALTDTNFNPASVTLNGDLTGWGGVAMTNNPTAANTNIYSVVFTIGQGSPVNWQYRYTELSGGNTVYDHFNGANGGQGNRYYLVPDVTVTNLPPVFFNDAALDDYITQPTPVSFSVDMTGAVGTDAHAFDPTADGLYINGQFANWYAWAGGINPASAPAGFQMMQVGSSMIFTNTVIIPAGTPLGFAYKYGMDPNNQNLGPLDDEAASGSNHYRVVRATAFNPYPMPQDKFGYQYSEPLFSSVGTTNGELSIGALAGGKTPISWLGRPGARLQTTTNVLSANWQTIAATDGTNWTVGYNSTNGFVSTTNWPAANSTFFRLIKQ